MSNGPRKRGRCEDELETYTETFTTKTYLNVRYQERAVVGENTLQKIKQYVHYSSLLKTRGSIIANLAMLNYLRSMNLPDQFLANVDEQNELFYGNLPYKTLIDKNFLKPGVLARVVDQGNCHENV
jgi:hypothetical protein